MLQPQTKIKLQSFLQIIFQPNFNSSQNKKPVYKIYFINVYFR